jgi:transcriptional antiterminator Rof (Rho-off)
MVKPKVLSIKDQEVIREELRVEGTKENLKGDNLKSFINKEFKAVTRFFKLSTREGTKHKGFALDKAKQSAREAISNLAMEGKMTFLTDEGNKVDLIVHTRIIKKTLGQVKQEQGIIESKTK